MIGVSPMLGLLRQEMAGLPVEYYEDGRDGLVIQLVVAEIPMTDGHDFRRLASTNVPLGRIAAGLGGRPSDGDRSRPWL